MDKPTKDSSETSIVVSNPGQLGPPGGERPEQNPALQYLMSLGTKASRRTMRGVLDRAARTFDALDSRNRAAQSTVDALSYQWGQSGAITFAKVQAAVSVMAEERGRSGAPKKSAARLMCSALRGVARFAFNLDQLDAAERMRIDDVRPPKLSGKTRGRRLSNAEVARLYKVCAADASPLGRRDAALLAVALGGGARRFEIAALDLADYTRPSRLGRDPVELVVRAGKGGKHDTLVAPPDVAEAIEGWLDVRGRDAGPLFPASPGRGRGLARGSRLSAAGVYHVVVRRSVEAGIAPEIAPHDLRRTAITLFLERTGDLALAKTFARHADPGTTAKYDHREHDALRKAVAGARTGYRGE